MLEAVDIKRILSRAKVDDKKGTWFKSGISRLKSKLFNIDKIGENTLEYLLIQEINYLTRCKDVEPLTRVTMCKTVPPPKKKKSVWKEFNPDLENYVEDFYQQECCDCDIQIFNFDWVRYKGKWDFNYYCAECAVKSEVVHTKIKNEDGEWK